MALVVNSLLQSLLDKCSQISLPDKPSPTNLHGPQFLPCYPNFHTLTAETQSACRLIEGPQLPSITFLPVGHTVPFLWTLQPRTLYNLSYLVRHVNIGTTEWNGYEMDTVNLQNVLLQIENVPRLSILNPDGAEGGTTDGLVRCNWRKLRGRLPNLFLTDDYNRSQVAEWLNDAGYVTVSGGQCTPFTPTLLTPEVEQTLYHWAYLVGWSLASFGPKTLSRLKARIDRYRIARERGHIAPMMRLLRDIGAAEDLDFKKWDRFLSGLATSDSISARLALHMRGRPLLTITPDSPMHAIIITIFIDRILTKRTLKACKWCGRQFEAHAKNQMFCPDTGHGVTHQTLWKTKFHRNKVKAVRAAIQEGRRKWNEVASQATATMRTMYPKEPKERQQITPNWARDAIKGAKKQ